MPFATGEPSARRAGKPDVPMTMWPAWWGAGPPAAGLMQASRMQSLMRSLPMCWH